jgi:hypothetical protein
LPQTWPLITAETTITSTESTNKSTKNVTNSQITKRGSAQCEENKLNMNLYQMMAVQAKGFNAFLTNT